MLLSNFTPPHPTLEAAAFKRPHCGQDKMYLDEAAVRRCRPLPQEGMQCITENTFT